MDLDFEKLKVLSHNDAEFNKEMQTIICCEMNRRTAGLPVSGIKAFESGYLLGAEIYSAFMEKYMDEVENSRHDFLSMMLKREKLRSKTS